MKTSKTNRTCDLLLMLSLILLSTIKTAAQDSLNTSSPVRDRWSYNTAYVMPQHRWETGIAQPFRYGLTNKMEIYSNLLGMAVFPNAGIKIAHGTQQKFLIASDHSVSYPTLFMNTVRAKGAGGLISPQFDIPTIFSFANSVMVTTKVTSTSFITGSLGFTFAVRSKKPDPLSTIDLPLIYPRMAHYYEGSSFQIGSAYKASVGKRWFFEESAELFCITRAANNFFFENGGAVLWNPFRSFRIKVGYNLSYGRYPFGTMWQLWPSLDLLIGSKVK